jgi:hypothetical protein
MQNNLDNRSWHILIEGYLDNILMMGPISFSNEERKMIFTRVNDILQFIEDGESNGVSWAGIFLEKFCTIGYNNGDKWKKSDFWWIKVGNICSEKVPMKLPSLLIGQTVAQSIHEVLTNKEIWKADILHIVEDDLRWTTDDKGLAMKRTWKIMMSKRGQGSCWES